MNINPGLFPNKGCLFEIKCLFFHCLGNIVDGEWERTFAEFGGVKGLQAVVKESWMLLRQAERFVGLTVVINITEVGFAVEAVVAL